MSPDARGITGFYFIIIIIIITRYFQVNFNLKLVK
jgi:hypothetical protein